METHKDTDAFMNRLEERAQQMKAAQKSTITGGAEGEHPLAEYNLKGFAIRHMPDDEQKILRISIGGGQTPVPLNYLVFRGNRKECIDLLRKALQALYEVDK